MDSFAERVLRNAGLAKLIGVPLEKVIGSRFKFCVGNNPSLYGYITGIEFPSLTGPNHLKAILYIGVMRGHHYEDSEEKLFYFSEPAEKAGWYHLDNTIDARLIKMPVDIEISVKE